MNKLVLVAVAATILVGAPIQASEPTIKERIDQHLLDLQNHIVSMTRKFKNEIGGLSPSDPSRPLTPARICCSGNLDHIEKSVLALIKEIDTLSACYENENLPSSVADAQFARNDLRALAQALRTFNDARTRVEADPVLGGVARAFNLFKQTVEGLAPCGEPAAGDTGKGDADKNDSGKK